MNQDVSPSSEIAKWTSDVKQRLDSISDQRDAKDRILLPDDICADIVEALDKIDSLHGELPAWNGNIGEGAVLESIDSCLAGWQANISTAFTDSSAKQLASYLSDAESLVSSLRDRESSLQNHEENFVAQQAEIEDKLAHVLKLQAKVARQRKNVAKDLRARKAEALLDIEKSRSQIISEQEALAQESVQKEITELQQQIELHTAETAALEKKLAEQESSSDSLRDELDQARANAPSSTELDELRETASQLQQELDEQKSLNDKQARSAEEDRVAAEQGIALSEENEQLAQDNEALQSQIGEFRSQLESRDEQLERLLLVTEELEESRSRITELEGELMESAESSIASNELADENAALRTELEEAIQSLQAAQESAKAVEESDTASDAREQADKLEKILQQTREELEDLREQNTDLASQLAKQEIAKVSAGASQRLDADNLSWEERKQLIMQQLECDENEEFEDETSASSRMEIKTIVDTTQAEIDRRDREIAELQSIVEQQADTKQGVAIGAAAIAQMMDSDELIQDERQKLKTIQQEWEDKLRQSEIDISLERAKLARERTELEARLAEMEKETVTPANNSNAAAGGRTRKWLEHLGLKEDDR